MNAEIVAVESAAEACDDAGVVAANEAEAAFVVSTNLASVQTINAMEVDTGKPVTTINQAAFWHALRLVGSNATIPEYGDLLDR